MKRLIMLLMAALSFHAANAQPGWKKSVGNLAMHVFTPALEIGYVFNNSPQLLNCIMFKGAAEYRFINTHGPLIRGNYDTYDARYQLTDLPGTTNLVRGTAFFSDLMLGGGYRIGNLRQRVFGLIQYGFKFYDFPSVSPNASLIEIRWENKRVGTGRVTAGYEYYLNLRSAFTLECMYGQVFRRIHFWEQSGSSWALSFGFTTALN